MAIGAGTGNGAAIGAAYDKGKAEYATGAAGIPLVNEMCGAYAYGTYGKLYAE